MALSIAPFVADRMNAMNLFSWAVTPLQANGTTLFEGQEMTRCCTIKSMGQR